MSAVETQTDAVNQTLTAGTYYYGVGGDVDVSRSAHFKWDASLVATITIEDTNFPDVAISSTASGDWIQENPSSAYVGVTGGSAAGLTITVPGGFAGGAMVHLSSFGSRRLRAKVVVSTQGALRLRNHGKE